MSARLFRFLIAIVLVIGGTLLGPSLYAEDGLPNSWHTEDQQRFLKAIATGDLETVQKYLNAGMSPNTDGAFGVPALYLAEMTNQPAIMHLLVRYGADLNAKWGPAQRTALHDAAIAGRLECIQVLLKAGADPNALNAFGRTPLDFASKPPFPLKSPPNLSEIVEALREHGGR